MAESIFSDLGVKAAESSWNQLARFIADRFTAYIQANARSTGNLADAIEAIPEFDVNNEVTISVRSKQLIQDGEFNTYYFFVDEGVNAIPFVPEYTYTRSRVESAPFSFKTIKSSEAFITTLTQSYAVGVPEAWAIATSIKKHGIAPRNITVNVMTDEFIEQIAEKAQEITGQGLIEFFNETFVQWQSR